jgi:hypothetical protein
MWIDPAIVWIMAAVVVGLAALFTYVSDQQERRRSAARTSALMDVTLVDQVTYADVVSRFGVVAEDAELPEGCQAVVARISWHGPAYDGSYQVLLLDARTSPAKPLTPIGGWDADGSAGIYGSSAYNGLSVAYEWLGGAQPVRDGIGGTDALMTVGTRAQTSGSLVAVFLAGRDESQFADSRQVSGALILMPVDGSVRWAKQLTPQS